jgi:plasmid stability protein
MGSRATPNPCYTGRVVANLTITIDDALLRRARIRALEHGTSVNALLRDYLTAYAGLALQQERALADLLALSAAATSRRGVARWTREDLHEREATPETGALPETDTGR